eukprot:12325548-Prorocentrum_lima.AAC.1
MCIRDRRICVRVDGVLQALLHWRGDDQVGFCDQVCQDGMACPVLMPPGGNARPAALAIIGGVQLQKLRHR